MKFFVCVLGVAMIIEGLPWFAFPEKFKNYLELLLETPPATMRRVGFALMAGGLAMVYLGTQ